MALCERPMVWLDLTPSPASSGSMKLSKKSMNSALARRSTARTSLLTSVENTIGWPFCLLGGDARQAFLGLLGRVDEGQGDLVELDALELREQAVAEHLRRDAGAVGDEEDGSAL